MDENSEFPSMDSDFDCQPHRPMPSRKRNAKVAMNFKTTVEFRHLYKLHAALHDLTMHELLVATFESHKRETARLAALEEKEIKK